MSQFKVKITGGEEDCRLCLFPAVFSTAKPVIFFCDGEPDPERSVLVYSDPEPLRKAGVDCDMVADDTSPDYSGFQPCRVESMTDGFDFRDFRRSVLLEGIVVHRITIKASAHALEVYSGDLEFGNFFEGKFGGTNFIPFLDNYQEDNSIDIDFAKSYICLCLRASSLMIVTVPRKSVFEMTFYYRTSCQEDLKNRIGFFLDAINKGILRDIL